MDVVHCAEMEWGESLVAQRGATAGMAHKRLFEGVDNSPDNYMLVMSREPNTYFSPRHRHPWDQVRVCLEGRIPIAKGLTIDAGEIGYFPESAHYGPQEGGTDRIVLLLQFGGASGQGFIGPDRLKQARLALAEAGRFEGGVYTVETPAGRTNRDAYEAVWDYVKGAAPAYASAAYKAPIVMRPEAFAWRETPEPGVAVRELGGFPHRGLTFREWRIDPGYVHQCLAEPTLRFLFVTAGAGTVNDSELRRWSAVRLQPGESASLSAATPLQVTELAVQPVAAAGKGMGGGAGSAPAGSEAEA